MIAVIPSKLMIISFDVREKKGVTCIPMKDANIKYLFECDERQESSTFPMVLSIPVQTIAPSTPSGM